MSLDSDKLNECLKSAKEAKKLREIAKEVSRQQWR